jgi:hypothetical protein
MSTTVNTEGNRQRLLFSSHGRRAVHADFSAGRLSSDASGALLLREADRRIGLLDAFDKAVRDPRDPDLIQHQQRTLLGQRIIGLAQGYEDLNDQHALRHDPAMRVAIAPPDAKISIEDPMASPPTLCRLENRVTRKDFWRLAEVLVDQFIASINAQGGPGPSGEPLILDFDATDVPLHGRQEFAFFHGYYRGYCYLPLYVFCGDHLLVAYLRPSDCDAALHTRAILKLLTQKLRRAWPDVRLVFRGDGGFCRHKLMRWCDANGIGYVIGIGRNCVLEKQAQPWTIPAQILFNRHGEKQRFFGSFGYAASTWDRPRRIIVKAEHLHDERDENGMSNTRLIVTNLAGDEQVIYDEIYCARGEMENHIKEQQMFLFGGRMSCGRFSGNQFRLLLSAAAYTLIGAVRRLALHGTELADAQADTIRLRLFKIAGRVVVSARRLLVQLSSSCPSQALFRLAVDRLMNRAEATPPAALAGG